LLTHATSNLGIWLNGKIGLYLEDLANPKIGLNLVPNCLQRENVVRQFNRTNPKTEINIS